MALPRNSLRAFLQHAKRSLANAARGNQKVNIVVGNESADLDSLTSSLLYAYTRSIVPPQDALAPLYIPLLNIPASALPLRPEFAAVCRHANVPPSSLITLDDLPDQFAPVENVSWILVDHNKLQGSLGRKYSAFVHGVIDHHEEENAVPQQTEPEPRIIEKCGSCTSLVVQYCRNSWDGVSSSSLSSGATHGQGEAVIDDSAVSQGWDAQVAKMAIASILIDTANFTASGKVEKADTDAVEYLEAKIKLSPKDAKFWDRDNYYEEVSEAKRNIDGLTINEILRKDYKQWVENGINLGISSVVKPLEFLVTKANEDQNESRIEDELNGFMTQQDLEVFAIMTTSSSEDGHFKRELLIQTKAPRLSSVLNDFADREKAALGLEAISVKNLTSERFSGARDVWRQTWLQKDVSKSRKQVAPMLREALREGHS